MYESIPLVAPLMGVRIQDAITGREHRELVDRIREHARRHGPVRLLVEYDTGPGLMGAEDLYDNLRFAKEAGAELARMAVIGRRDFQDTWVGLFGLFGGIQAAYYDHGRREAALAWLTEQP
jgi:hypothetical protein